MVCPDSSPPSDLFDHFCAAQTFRAILSLHKRLCLSLNIKPCQFPQFYPKLKAGLKSWKAQGLFAKFDKRASLKCYGRGLACTNTKVLVIGCGPCGLRAAIEAQLLGARVVVIEKRDRFSRNNVLHLWPMVIHDLKCLGAKMFFGKFCAGAIDHISIRQLQCILLKVALLLGVDVYESVGFRELVEPVDCHTGWRAMLEPEDHCVSHFQFDVLIGADGKRNTFKCFKRKEFRGKLAIAVTANFVNRCTEAEARVDEISGVAFIFNQKFFKDMFFETGIDLENIVYYKDETHYFVMTAKKQCLLKKGVIKQDYMDTVKLLSAENVSRENLMEFAREAANFATDYQMPGLVFALNHYGREDVAMFDFTCMYASANASCVLERRGCKLLLQLVGDSLLEPFWPTGSGCARGFLSCLDAGWQLRSWANPSVSMLDCLAERESVYRLLAQTTPANISKQFSRYSLDPRTRYPNLNRRVVLASQVRGLVDTDNPSALAALLASSSVDGPPDRPPGRGRPRRRTLDPAHQRELLRWCGEHVRAAGLHVQDFDRSFQSGDVLSAILRYYRPGLAELKEAAEGDCSPQQKNMAALAVARSELGVAVSSSLQSALSSGAAPDRVQMSAFIDRLYSALHGEIPYRRPDVIDLPPILSPSSISSSHNENRSRKRRSEKLIKSSSSYEAGERTSARSLDKDPERQQVFASKVRDIQAKMTAQDFSSSKKPKDLLRSIGKIEESDWNIKQIEDKIKQQTSSKVADNSEKRLPHWSRERFDDKLQALSDPSSVTRQKYNAIDQELRRLENRLREGNVRDVGERGANRVSHMARRFLSSELDGGSMSAVDGAPTAPPSVSDHAQRAEVSNSCHFCCGSLEKEAGSAEGLFFHSECFRCEFCETALKTGCYAFDEDSRRFFCLPHYGLHALARYKYQRNPDTNKLAPPSPTSERKLRGQTTERAEFENSSCMDFSSDDESLSEMDEDEWTDHNFGVSAVESAREPIVDESDSDHGLSAEEELSCSDENEFVCERDNKAGRACWLHGVSPHARSNDPSEFYESDGIEQEYIESASDSEVEVQARNKRLLETRLADSILKSKRAAEASHLSDTESWTSSSESSSSDSEETEVPTDPEFDPPIQRPLPTIVIDDSASRPPPEASIPPPHVSSRSALPTQPVSSSDRNDVSRQSGQKSSSNIVQSQPQLRPAANAKSIPLKSRTSAVFPRGSSGLQKCRTDTQVNVRLVSGRANSGSEASAWKSSLALKKKYLTDQSDCGTVQATTAKTDLDSRVNSFMSRISETQKLLNPARPPTGRDAVSSSSLGAAALSEPTSKFSWLSLSSGSSRTAVVDRLTRTCDRGVPSARRLMRSATDVGFPDRLMSGQTLARLPELGAVSATLSAASDSTRADKQANDEPKSLAPNSILAGETNDVKIATENHTSKSTADHEVSCTRAKSPGDKMEDDAKPVGFDDKAAFAAGNVCSGICRDACNCFNREEQNVDAGKVTSDVPGTTSLPSIKKYTRGGEINSENQSSLFCVNDSSTPIVIDFIDAGDNSNSVVVDDSSQAKSISNDASNLPNGAQTVSENIKSNSGGGSNCMVKFSGRSSTVDKSDLALRSAAKPDAGFQVLDKRSFRSSLNKSDNDCLLRSQSIQFPTEAPSAVSSRSVQSFGVRLAVNRQASSSVHRVTRPDARRGSCPDVSSASARLCASRFSPTTLRRSTNRGVRDLQQNNQTIQRLVGNITEAATSPVEKQGSGGGRQVGKPPVASPRRLVRMTECSVPAPVSSQEVPTRPVQSSHSTSSRAMYPLRRCHTDLSSSCQASVVRDLVLARVTPQRPARRRLLPSRTCAPSGLYRAPPPPHSTTQAEVSARNEASLRARFQTASLGSRDNSSLKQVGLSVRKPHDDNQRKGTKPGLFTDSEPPSESLV